MVTGVDVTKIGQVRQRWHMLLPATAPQQKVMFWQGPGRLKKERMHPCFTVWQAIPEKTKRPDKAWIRLDRVMCLGVQRVIDGHTGAGPKRLIRLDHRQATAIGEDQIVLRNALAEGII